MPFPILDLKQDIHIFGYLSEFNNNNTTFYVQFGYGHAPASGHVKILYPVAFHNWHVNFCSPLTDAYNMSWIMGLYGSGNTSCEYSGGTGQFAFTFYWMAIGY